MPRPLPPGTWPKASDEADGNAGRPQAWFFPDHRRKIFLTLPITGKTYFGFFRITGKNYFVLYRAQAKTISYSTDHRQKIFRTLPKRYFGLYLLVGGRKPYTIWNPIYCKDSWRDYPLP